MTIKPSKPVLIVKNISNKTVGILGMRVPPGKKVDLINAVPGLTEAKILNAMSVPNGELYKKISVFKTLVISKSSFVTLQNASNLTADSYKLHGLNVGKMNKDLGFNKKISDYASEIAEEQLGWHEYCTRTLSLGMSGDMKLKLGTVDGYHTAASLNGAASGANAAKHLLAVSLQSVKGDKHVWASFSPIVTVSEFVADADVSAPTITNTPKFSKGSALIELAFDVDAGSTKVYTAGDYIEVEVKVMSDNKLLGWAVASVTATVTMT